jgi:hypothetical protein
MTPSAQRPTLGGELIEGMGFVLRHRGPRNQNDRLSSCSYADATADALGVDKRTVERDVSRV